LQTADAVNSQLYATTPTGTSGFLVTGRKAYTAMASFRTAATARGMRCELTFYNSAGAILLTSAGTSITDSTSAWQQATVTEVAPAAAVYARLIVGSDGGTPVSGEIHYVDKIGVFLGTNTSWSAGGPQDIFNGFVEAWPQTWPVKRNDALVPLMAVDAFEVLSRASHSGLPWETAVRNSGTLAYWYRLGEASGSTAGDSSGAAGSGDAEYVVNGGTAITYGVTTLAASGDTDTGITSGTLSYVHSTAVAGVFGATCAFGLVLKRSAVPTDPYYVLLQTDSAATGGCGIIINVDGTATAEFTASGVAHTVTSTTNVCDDVAHLVIATQDASQFYIYVDGVDVSTGRTGSNAAIPTSDQLWISGTAGHQGGTESLDEVFGYNTALTATLIDDLYDAWANAWNGDLSGARITRVLDLANVASADRNIDTGQSTLQAATLGNSALEHCQLVERSEQGAFYVQKDGKFRWRSRQAPLTDSVSVTSQLTFGDANDGVEIPYVDVGEFSYGADKIVNEVHANRRDGDVKVSKDASSQTTYLKRVDSSTLTDTEVASDSEMQDAADWRLAHYKDPAVRPSRIAVKPVTFAVWAPVLALEIGHRVTIKRRPPGGGTISKECLVEAIEHEITPNEWTVILDLSPAETQVYWVLGTTNFTELGTNTRLGY